MTWWDWLVRQLRRASVNKRLVITFAAVAIVPLFVTTGIVANISTRSAEQTIQTQAVGTIGQVADSVSAQLSALERSSVKLSYAQPVQELLTENPDGAAAAEWLDDARSEVADEFYLTNDVVSVQVTPGNGVWHDIVGDSSVVLGRVHAGFHDAVAGICDQGGRSLYDSFRADVGAAGDQRSIPLISQWRPVYSRETKEQIGYIVITVEERYLSSVVVRVSEIPGSRAVIVADHDYRIVSNVGPGLLRTGDTLASDIRLGPSTPAGAPVTLEDKSYRAATAPVPNTDLTTVLLIPTDYLFASRDTAVRAFFAVAAVAGLIALGISLLMARSVTQPIDRLMRKIEGVDAAGAHAAGKAVDLHDDPANDELARLDRQFNAFMGEIREHQREREDHLNERHRMELKVLQAQVNPHFVANALGSMRQLAGLGNTAAVSELSGALAGMINRTFRRPGDWSTLAEEFDSVRDYGVIASYRHMGRILQTEELPDELAGCEVPQFILQPLVENAYTHGFGDNAVGGRISIRARCDGRTVTVDVSDNGAGADAALIEEVLASVPDPSAEVRPGSGPAATAASSGLTHFGLRSVAERLRLLYGGEAQLTIDSEPWIFTVVSIAVPLRGGEGPAR